MQPDYSQLGPSKPPPEITSPLRVGIVATPNFTLMPLACFTDFLRLAGDEGDFSRRIYCDWDLLSHSLDPIRSSCGLELTPGRTYGNPSDYDFIVVHGGILHADHRIPPELYDFVTAAVCNGVPVAGNCSGSFVLAEAGLLAGKKCAVHFTLAGLLRQTFPDITPITDRPVVVDGDVITCPGGLASIKLAMYLVSNACGNPVRTRRFTTFSAITVSTGKARSKSPISA